MDTICSQRARFYSSLKQSEVVSECSETFDLSFWNCSYRGGDIAFEGFVKVRGGIKYLRNRYREISVCRALSDVEQYGFFSARPFRLGQSVDWSTLQSILALFLNFCIFIRQCPDDLCRLAEGNAVAPPCWTEIRMMADWQGIIYPSRWSNAEVAALSLSANESHCPDLALIISRMLHDADPDHRLAA